MTGLDDAARNVAALFERLGVPYAIMGGLAVRAYALPRPTFDVDFIASITRDALPSLFQAAEDLGFTIPAVQRTGWVDQVHGLPVVKFQWFLDDRTIDIDVFLAETPFQKQILDRRQRHAGENWETWFVTVEDLILLKLLADRPKDRADIADLLFIQSRVDVPYLKTWAEKLGVSAALDAALQRSAE